jgi:hypothetical protein
MPVNMPQKTQNPIMGILPVAGSVVGGIFGGPAGAAAGGKIGGELGKQTPAPDAVETKTPMDAGAIDRRIGATEESPSFQLAKADAALKQLPPEYQQQYGATISAARQMDQQGGN